MNLKKLGLGIVVFSLIVPATISGCVEKTDTERVEIDKTNPVVVPDKGDVDVNVHTDSQPAPVIEKNTETNTNTTIDRHTTGDVSTETKTESTTVH